MKTYFTSLFGTVAISCLVATAASCSDHQKEPGPTAKSIEASPAPASNRVPERTLPPSTVAASPVAAVDNAPAADVFAETSVMLDRATKNDVSSLTAVPDSLSRGLDAGIANWKAKGGSSSNMGDSKLELARTDFAQKVRTLTLADEDTWKSAKSAAQTSLDNLRQAYAALLSGEDRNK